MYWAITNNRIKELRELHEIGCEIAKLLTARLTRDESADPKSTEYQTEQV